MGRNIKRARCNHRLAAVVVIIVGSLPLLRASLFIERWRTFAARVPARDGNSGRDATLLALQLLSR